ncbi:MAG: tetraacyldisaccharide 4'-kinase [Verrucomicrobiota bacterium]
MKEKLEELEQYGIEVILGRKRGFKAGCLRSALWVLSGVYHRLVALRMLLYQKRVLREANLGCLVISVGNLTVGGTGKTPVVEFLARALQQGGRKVAILSRGYKAKKPPLGRRVQMRLRGRPFNARARVVSDGESVRMDSSRAGDEPFMLASNLPGVPVVVDRDRVKAGVEAIRRFGADTLLLDDGLQYLRLGRRLDVVLIDRSAPFGNEHLLPRGTLREPAANLKRASYIFITKCREERNDELIDRLRSYNQFAEIIECTHQPTYFEHVLTGEQWPLDFIKGQYVGSVSGIAVPQSFERSLERLGAEVGVRKRCVDHHRYTFEELEAFAERCSIRDADCIVTTEKDAVRFPKKFKPTDMPIYFLRVEIRIIRGQEVWQKFVERICQPLPARARNRWLEEAKRLEAAL